METATTSTISSAAVLKNGSYIVAFVAAAEYLHLTPVSISILAGLIATDVLTGVVKAGTINGWGSIRSSIMERGVLAKALVILTPLTVALSGKGIGIDLSAIAQSIISVLILSETYSIVGNIYAVKTGKISTEFDAIAYVLGQVKEILKKIIMEDPIGPKK